MTKNRHVERSRNISKYYCKEEILQLRIRSVQNDKTLSYRPSEASGVYLTLSVIPSEATQLRSRVYLI